MKNVLILLLVLITSFLIGDALDIKAMSALERECRERGIIQNSEIRIFCMVEELPPPATKPRPQIRFYRPA